MHITIDASLTGGTHAELEVAWGTPVSTLLGMDTSTPVWCGSVELAPAHRAGEWPLVAGALLTDRPSPCASPPRGLHLAVISGPDAGAIVALSGPTSVGTCPPPGRGARPSLTIADDTVDAMHAIVAPQPSGGATVTDAGTVNGTRVWSRSAEGLRRGRRARSASVRAGDVIEMGRTRVELRDTAARHAAAVATAPPAIPDPTSPGTWTPATWIDGPFAAATARAVVLARGRRPPDPADFADFAEPWWQWLPPASPGDAPIRRGAGAADEGAACLIASQNHTTVRDQAAVRSAPVVRVTAATAELLARAIAGGQPEPVPTSIRWADIAGARVGARTQCAEALHDRAEHSWRVVAGIDADAWAHGAAPWDQAAFAWEIDLDAASPHIAVTGRAQSGRTTLLATITAALASAHPPHELEIVAICPRAPGPLGPCLAMPHVREAALGDDVTLAAGALARVVALIAERRARDAAVLESRVLVVVDDLDAFGPEGRRVWALCDEIARDGAAVGVTLAAATARPTAVLSAALRARVGTMVALGVSSEAESVELMGVATGARLPPDTPGRAAVRSHGTVRTVHVALPTADRTPPVRPYRSEPPQGRHLAEWCARDA